MKPSLRDRIGNYLGGRGANHESYNRIEWGDPSATNKEEWKHGKRIVAWLHQVGIPLEESRINNDRANNIPTKYRIDDDIVIEFLPPWGYYAFHNSSGEIVKLKTPQSFRDLYEDIRSIRDLVERSRLL